MVREYFRNQGTHNGHDEGAPSAATDGVTATVEDEDSDPVGARPLHDARENFSALAQQAAIIEVDEPLSDEQFDFAQKVVETCAKVADRYRRPERPQETVGDTIRALLIQV